MSELALARPAPDVVPFFRALADETRWRIVQLLSDEPMCVCELADILRMPQSSVSSHLQVIKKGRLLDSTLCYSPVIRVQVFRTMSSFTFSNLFSLPSNLGRTPASASPKWSVSRSNRTEVSESRRASERGPR